MDQSQHSLSIPYKFWLEDRGLQGSGPSTFGLKSGEIFPNSKVLIVAYGRSSAEGTELEVLKKLSKAISDLGLETSWVYGDEEFFSLRANYYHAVESLSHFLLLIELCDQGSTSDDFFLSKKSFGQTELSCLEGPSLETIQNHPHLKKSLWIKIKEITGDLI